MTDTELDRTLHDLLERLSNSYACQGMGPSFLHRQLMIEARKQGIGLIAVKNFINANIEGGYRG